MKFPQTFSSDAFSAVHTSLPCHKKGRISVSYNLCPKYFYHPARTGSES